MSATVEPTEEVPVRTATPDAAPPATAAGGGGAPSGGRRDWSASRWVWVAMGLIIVAALFAGTRPDDTPRTNEERAHALADGLKCPTCRSQSVADSDAPVSKEIRAEINRRIEAGETDEAIRDYLVGRFGTDVVLTPSASGVTGLVWVLPVVLVVAGGVALGFAFRRWRRRSPVAVTDADRALVAEARRARGADPAGTPDGGDGAAPDEDAHDEERPDGDGDGDGTAAATAGAGEGDGEPVR